MQLGQLLVRLGRIGDQQLIDDPIAKHETHDMPQQTLHNDAQTWVVEALLSKAEKEGRVVDRVDVGVERLGKRDECEMGKGGDVGSGWWWWRCTSVSRERVGCPAVDASLEARRRVLDGELREIWSK